MSAPLLAFDNGVIVWMFYAWIVVSVVWFLRNSVHNRQLARHEAQAAAEHKSEKTRELKYIVADSSSSTPEVDLRQTQTAPKLLAASPSGARTVPTGPTASAPSPDPIAEPESSLNPGPIADPVVEPKLPPAPKRRPVSIAQLLTGIRLPQGLLPVVPHGEPATDQRVALISNASDPMDIGIALADELERLNYEIETISTDQAVARRGENTLSLRIHARAEELENDAGLLFPNSAPDSVVVELWVGGNDHKAEQ